MYKVVSAGNPSTPKYNGYDGFAAQANSTAEAKALVKGYNPDDVDAVWTNATVTDMTAVLADLTGWTFLVHVNTTIPVNVSVVGIAGDTLDILMARMVTALLTGTGSVGTAIAGTAHSAYNTSTNVLTVSSIADNIGDKTITITVTPPTGLFVTGYSWAQTDLVASKVDGGSAGAVLTVTFSTTWLVPGVCFGFKS